MPDHIFTVSRELFPHRVISSPPQPLLLVQQLSNLKLYLPTLDFASASTLKSPRLVRMCTFSFAADLATVYRYLTSLCSVTVDSHRALHEYDIVKMILLYLKDEPKALAKAMRTCPLFIKAGVGILWEDAKPSDLLCIQDTRRRLEFAPFLKIVTLWSDEQVRDTETMI